MAQVRAIVSSWAALADKEFLVDHLKLCFLWYDEIMIETVGDYQLSHFYQNLLEQETLSNKEISSFSDVVLPLDKRVPKDLLDGYWASKDHGYPRWGKDCENYTYPKPQNAEQYAHNVLLLHIEKEWGGEKLKGYGVEQAEGRARVAVESIRLWEIINMKVPCMLQANRDEKLAMMATQSFNSEDPAPAEAFRLFEMTVPSLTKVSWNNIIDIKRRGDFDSLREKMSDVFLTTSGNLDEAQQQLMSLEENAVEKIIEENRPNIKKVAFESAVSNVPSVPIVNPAGVFFGLRDFRNEVKKARELNWFYLLRDIRSLEQY